MIPSASIIFLTAVISIIFIPLVGLWLWALTHCANAEFKQPIDKVVWVIILIFLGPLGLFLYLASGRKQAITSKSNEKWVI
jgi:hypothetical protein